MDFNGDYKRREALEACNKRGAHILYQLLQSPKLEINGHFWSMEVSQHQLVEEICSLLHIG